jgi:hypothetical protein
VNYKAHSILLFLLLSLKAIAQFPVQLGINAGYISYPLTGGGYNFEGGENFSNPDTPHMEKGLSGGFNFLIPLKKDLFLLTHTNLATYHSHVHYPSPFTNGHFDAPFRLMNVRQSISLNKAYLVELPDIKFKTKVFGGIALNSPNLSSSISGSGPDFKYYTNVRVKGFIYPELFAGVGLIQKIPKAGTFYFDVSFNTLPYKQIFSYAEFQVIDNTGAEADVGSGHKYIFLNIIFFPEINYFKKRRSWSICK